jgi:hypothetical protein
LAITVTLNNISFEIPEVGDENYGEDLTAYLVELSEVINSISAPLDIPQTNFVFTNNESTPSNVVGLNFPTANVASFDVEYVITRENATDKLTERGKLLGFQGDAGWQMARGDASNDVTNTNFPSSDGNIGIEFSITSGGQVQYTSNDFTGQISGIMTFTAKTVQQ